MLTLYSYLQIVIIRHNIKINTITEIAHFYCPSSFYPQFHTLTLEYMVQFLQIYEQYIQELNIIMCGRHFLTLSFHYPFLVSWISWWVNLASNVSESMGNNASYLWTSMKEVFLQMKRDDVLRVVTEIEHDLGEIEEVSEENKL